MKNTIRSPFKKESRAQISQQHFKKFLQKATSSTKESTSVPRGRPELPRKGFYPALNKDYLLKSK